jgi:hypothetical protein
MSGWRGCTHWRLRHSGCRDGVDELCRGTGGGGSVASVSSVRGWVGLQWTGERAQSERRPCQWPSQEQSQGRDWEAVRRECRALLASRMYSQQKGWEERRWRCFAWLERAAGGGARRGQGLASGGRISNGSALSSGDSQSQHAREKRWWESSRARRALPFAAVAPGRRILQRREGAERTAPCPAQLSQHVAIGHPFSVICTQRFMGGQARRRQIDAQLGGPDACPAAFTRLPPTTSVFHTPSRRRTETLLGCTRNLP